MQTHRIRLRESWWVFHQDCRTLGSLPVVVVAVVAVQRRLWQEQHQTLFKCQLATTQRRVVMHS